MRQKKLFYTTISSFAFQATTIICGFILPRLILVSFGSEINGLVNSITQFLSLITFLELGVGAVVQSALYKPLAERNNAEISKIIVSASKFFKRLAQILLVYVIFLIIFYPYFANQEFGWVYTAGLIAAMSISSFAQYYFGIVDRLLLTADQLGYIQYTAQTVTLILNTAICAILIKCGASIHFVKLASSIIYLARPIFLRAYVNRHYSIDRKITYVGEPIKQKWNGVAQHVAAVVLDQTDSVVLTIFSTLSNVSIYSVYHLVTNGIKQLFMSMANGVRSVMGDMYVRQETEKLRDFFGWIEWLIHTGTVYIFGCTLVLIVPFVQVYTNNVNDANYTQPLFAVLIVLANAGHCLRLPYHTMILAGGHYKQTQSNYIIAAAMNIIISVITVNFCGLIGVAIGTLVAMVYQTVWMAVYVSKNLIKWPLRKFVKQICVDIVSFGLIYLITYMFSMNSVTYYGWIFLAIKVAVVSLVIVAGINLIFYRNLFKRLLKTGKQRMMKKINR